MIDADGHLGAVGHLTPKIEAAAREGIRLVVVSSLTRRRRFVPQSPYEVEIQGAESTTEAIRCTRVYANPRFRRLVRLSVAIGLGDGPPRGRSLRPRWFLISARVPRSEPRATE